MEAITIRFSAREADEIAALAEINGFSVAELARRHRRQWEKGKVAKCEKAENVTRAPEEKRTAFLRLSGLSAMADLEEWRAALVRDVRGALARYRPPKARGLRRGVDYLVEGE